MKIHILIKTIIISDVNDLLHIVRTIIKKLMIILIKFLFAFNKKNQHIGKTGFSNNGDYIQKVFCYKENLHRLKYLD